MSLPQRLKTTQVKPVRETMWREQGKVCALSRYPLALEDAVLDHCHKTGHVRGVLHRGVNALLGKLENNHKRYGVTQGQMVMMGKGLESYLTKDYSAMPLHPTYKTEDEKRIKRNKAARDRRAAAKDTP